jgi:hypothetical protein
VEFVVDKVEMGQVFCEYFGFPCQFSFKPTAPKSSSINRGWYNRPVVAAVPSGLALLEKLPTVQLLKNFPAFYGTRRFITVFTRALHWSLS